VPGCFRVLAETSADSPRILRSGSGLGPNTRRVNWTRLALCAVAGVGILGCQGWLGGPPLGRWPILPKKSDRFEKADPATRTAAGLEPAAARAKGSLFDYRVVLAEENGWMKHRRGSPAGSTWRWCYPALGDLLSRPPGERPELRAALADENPIVAANAAIGLARLGDNSGVEHLVAAIRAPNLKLSIRRAAAEALGTLHDPSVVGRLRQLIAQYGRPGSSGGLPYLPKLHAELIRGLAGQLETADDRCFVDGLRSPDAEVRLEALRAVAAGRRGSLPQEAVDLRADSDARVRAAAIGALARQRHPQARQYLSDALRDGELSVRIAAIAGLGELRDPQAQAVLEELLKDRAELIRAAAVSALAVSGAESVLEDAASDKSWRVRNAVALALVRYPNRGGASLARRLLDDPSSMVRRRVVASLDEWPLEWSGPILLVAMGKAGYLTRKTAASQLAARWPPGAEFPVEGPLQRRLDVLRRLKDRFGQQFGLLGNSDVGQSVELASTRPLRPEEITQIERLVRQSCDPGAPQADRKQAVQALVGLGPEMIPGLEHLALDRQQVLPEPLYREVLPSFDPAFAVLDRLASREVSVRRRASEQLVELTAKQPLGRLALARLAMLMASESDQLVWHGVLRAVAAEPSEPAIRLAYTAISHPLAEVRRRACEHLGAHADPRHVEVLLPALEDPSDLVVLAAVRALGAGGRLDDMRPLRRLLAVENEPLRAEVAGSLARLGDPSGTAALERLTYSADAQVRRQVASMMGTLARPQFVGALIRLLSDSRQSVRRAALASLPAVVGYDVAQRQRPAAANTTERIELWKRWYERRRVGSGS